MAKQKIAIALSTDVLRRLDGLVRHAGFPSRSQAVEQAIEEKLARQERLRLALECAKPRWLLVV